MSFKFLAFTIDWFSKKNSFQRHLDGSSGDWKAKKAHIQTWMLCCADSGMFMGLYSLALPTQGRAPLYFGISGLSSALFLLLYFLLMYTLAMVAYIGLWSPSVPYAFRWGSSSVPVSSVTYFMSVVLISMKPILVIQMLVPIGAHVFPGPWQLRSVLLTMIWISVACLWR